MRICSRYVYLHATRPCAPAAFSSSQKECTLAAAQAAGIEVLRLISEPAAAALAVLGSSPDIMDGHYLVFDFGGGTLDISVVKKSGTRFDTVLVEGDTLLGGRDIDELIFNCAVEEILKADESVPLKHGAGMDVAKLQLVDQTSLKLRL